MCVCSVQGLSLGYKSSSSMAITWLISQQSSASCNPPPPWKPVDLQLSDLMRQFGCATYCFVLFLFLPLFIVYCCSLVLGFVYSWSCSWLDCILVVIVLLVV